MMGSGRDPSTKYYNEASFNHHILFNGNSELICSGDFPESY